MNTGALETPELAVPVVEAVYSRNLPIQIDQWAVDNVNDRELVTARTECLKYWARAENVCKQQHGDGPQNEAAAGALFRGSSGGGRLGVHERSLVGEPIFYKS
jgi:hypothetical protein